MKKIVSGAMMLLLSLSAAAALEIQVEPQGDGIVGRERWSYGSYYDTSFNASANPNAAFHWSEGGDTQSRSTYMQIALGSLPDADNITEATLYINVIKTQNNGCDFYHAADSSSANGDASQEIGGNQFVANINGVTGWVGYDVTDYIKNDVTNGYAYAAFKFAYEGYSKVEFSSAESGEFAPYLSVVPEPATLLLLGIGGLTLLRRRS